MTTIQELKWSSMTPAVNEVKSPNQFIKKLLFGNHDPQATETIELSFFVGGREVAPFVRKNGEALMVKGTSRKFQTVEAPNIRIKHPFEPSELLFGRQPGTVIFPTADAQISAVQAHIARDIAYMADQITNAEEYLCCKALTGVIEYSVEDEEVFTITFPRLNSHNVSATEDWDDNAATALLDLQALKRLVSRDEGITITDGVMGEDATDAFLQNAEIKSVLDKKNISLGELDFTKQFQDDGAMFLGTIAGIRFWEYSRSVSIGGSDVPLIRPEYCEFVSNTPAAQNVLYYGAIPDMKALQGRLFRGERFSKSWEEEDPSVMMALTHSRPLPCPRRPNSMASFHMVGT